MSQTRSLPDKYYGENGIHRVPMWRMAGFSLNNVSTYTYMIMMNYVAYYLNGFVGVAAVTATSIAMYMRLWDGFTDPLIGILVDKTDGRFGKNRPFMVMGNIILCVMSYIMFHVTHKLPDSTPIRLTFMIAMELIYYVGYTFQCAVTKSAQTCLTNDPNQRPLFSVFDRIATVLNSTFITFVIARLAAKYGTFYDTRMFHDLWLTCSSLSAIYMIIAVISIAPKDRKEFYGTGETVKIGLKDYWDTLKNNRAIQMLVVAASTDKLAVMMHQSVVQIVLFGVVVGNFAVYAATNAVINVPNCILAVLLIGTIATKLGQRKAMIIGSIGGIITNGLLILLWIFGNPASMNGGDGVHWGYFAIIYVILMLLMDGFAGITGTITIPMTADCADYEVVRSGKYVPGMMGTLFSFVDKVISSFAPLLTGVVYAAIGFKDRLPDMSTPYSTPLLGASIFLMYGTAIIGLIFNLIAMKFYPLTKEKMQEIQSEIAAIKARTRAESEAAK